jgi:branched-chain amino acid transport system substrate-binding protein
MSKSTKVFLWLVLLVIVIFGLYKLSTSKNSGSGGQLSGAVKIGFIAPLTGDVASLGTVANVGAQIAVDEVNASGGIQGQQVQLFSEDGKCLGESANSAANKLINVDKVNAIVGGLCSGETAAFVPAAMQSKVLVMSPCSSAPNLTGAGKYFFRDYPSDAFQGKFGAEYAYNTLNARKVAVIYHISDYGTGIKNVFEQRFKELGGQIVFDEGTQQTATDYRTQLTKIKASGADLIYAAVYSIGGEILAKQTRQLGINTTILGADTWSDTKLQKDLNGITGILYTAGKTASTDEFKNKVLAKTKGTEVGICAAQAYDAVKLFAQAMNQVGVDPDKVAAALHSVNYAGVSGPIAFDKNGDLQQAAYTVSKIQNGSSVLVQ